MTKEEVATLETILDRLQARAEKWVEGEV